MAKRMGERLNVWATFFFSFWCPLSPAPASDKITFAWTSNRKIEMAKVIWCPHKAFASESAHTHRLIHRYCMWVQTANVCSSTCACVWVGLAAIVCIQRWSSWIRICLFTSPPQLVAIRQQCGRHAGRVYAIHVKCEWNGGNVEPMNVNDAVNEISMMRCRH